MIGTNCEIRLSDASPPAHLSAGLGVDEACDGAEVVVVRPDEDPEQRGFGPAPVHRFSLTGQLHLHWCLAPRVTLCTHTTQAGRQILHKTSRQPRELKLFPQKFFMADCCRLVTDTASASTCTQLHF